MNTSACPHSILVGQSCSRTAHLTSRRCAVPARPPAAAPAWAAPLVYRCTSRSMPQAKGHPVATNPQGRLIPRRGRRGVACRYSAALPPAQAGGGSGGGRRRRQAAGCHGSPRSPCRRPRLRLPNHRGSRCPLPKGDSEFTITTSKSLHAAPSRGPGMHSEAGRQAGRQPPCTTPQDQHTRSPRPASRTSCQPAGRQAAVPCPTRAAATLRSLAKEGGPPARQQTPPPQ